jgi:methylmalonyl-CoA mutase, C-terminal domain
MAELHTFADKLERKRQARGAQVRAADPDDQVTEPLRGDAMEPIRVVVAKPGLDGHDRGVKIVARALRDAGMEVVYMGLRQTPEMIAEAAVQEDADAVGLSILSGAHMTLFPRVVEALRERGAGDVLVFGGGIVPPDDIAELKRLGVAEVFTPGTPTGRIVDWLRDTMAARTGGGAPVP